MGVAYHSVSEKMESVAHETLLAIDLQTPFRDDESEFSAKQSDQFHECVRPSQIGNDHIRPARLYGLAHSMHEMRLVSERHKTNGNSGFVEIISEEAILMIDEHLYAVAAILESRS